MNNSAIETQITLPKELYQLLAKQAEVNGQSISNEIASLLTTLLMKPSTELEKEFQAWEAASDEDWLNMENTLISKHS